jgi:hypothetical protein
MNPPFYRYHVYVQSVGRGGEVGRQYEAKVALFTSRNQKLSVPETRGMTSILTRAGYFYSVNKLTSCQSSITFFILINDATRQYDKTE